MSRVATSCAPRAFAIAAICPAAVATGLFTVLRLPAPILRDRGLDAAAAGYVLSVSVVGQMVGCLVAPALATMGRDQRAVSVALYGLVLGGILGCFYAPLWQAWGWAALLSRFVLLAQRT